MSIEEEVRREGEAEEAEAEAPAPIRGRSPLYAHYAEWSKLQLQEPPGESPVDAELRKLAAEYHDRCEAYDRTVCLQRNKEGVAIPTNGYERTMIERYAYKVKEELVDRARETGATRMQLHDAIVAEARRRRGQ